MNDRQIIEEWSERLSSKLKRPIDEIREKGLSAYDFSPSKMVEITFPDRSFCKFNFAFSILDEEKKLVAVFTEHCGYYVFSVHGALVKEVTEDIFVDENYEL